ncbi:MAG: hypothetical protein K6G51_04835 [Sphaerochaetaceae bacterium]|nr:hypothetical protein [Sphaerochaetaceae bacterium]
MIARMISVVVSVLFLLSCTGNESGQRIDALTSSITTTSSRVDSLEKENAELARRISELEKTVQDKTAESDELRSALDKALAQLSSIEGELSSNKELWKRLSEVENALSMVEGHLFAITESEENAVLSPAYLDIVFSLDNSSRLSDRTAVSNALISGGEIYVSSDYSYTSKVWSELDVGGRRLELEDYGALGEDMTYYTRGAMINLTVGQGWKLFDIDYSYDNVVIYHFVR